MSIEAWFKAAHTAAAIMEPARLSGESVVEEVAERFGIPSRLLSVKGNEYLTKARHETVRELRRRCPHLKNREIAALLGIREARSIPRILREAA